MPTETVRVGAYYQHDNHKTVLRVESASTPGLDNYVHLVEPCAFAKCDGRFIWNAWRGKWEMFLEQWTEIDLPNGKDT